MQWFCVFVGGASSFVLALMCISLFQMHPKYNVNENASLGLWLVEFFDLYGRKFDYNDTCISILNGGQYFTKTNLHSFVFDKKIIGFLMH